MEPASAHAKSLLALTLTHGLGPVLIARLLDAFGPPDAVLGLTAMQLERVKGIGAGKSSAIAAALADAPSLVEAELGRVESAGARIVAKGEPGYPPLLTQIPNPPPLLYIRGGLAPLSDDRFPVAIVGSRHCSPYGLEQSERFAGIFARAGLTVVSGGARGIDTAGHRGAVRSSGRTVVVLGCGLGHTYPPENAELFDRVLGLGGSIISELPMDTAPTPENFPPRNRIISGMSLGVLVIEAAVGSGALITAKLAAEDHGREVFAVPGRVDSPTSRGTHELLKSGGALLVTDPGDVIQALEIPANHLASGTHRDRYTPQLFGADPPTPASASAGVPRPADRPPDHPVIDRPDALLEALVSPATLDQLLTRTGLAVAELRARLTMLELQKRVKRSGSVFERR